MEFERESNVKGRFYNWCLTMWQAQDETDDVFKQNYINKKMIIVEKMKYMVWGLEKCPSTEKLHIHAYVEFTEKVSRKWIKEVFEDNRLWCDPRSGTQKQAIDYVKKDETKVFEDYKYWERGEKKSQGNRSDLDSMVEAIENGMTGKEILLMFRGNALRHLGCIYKGLEAFHKMNVVDRLIEEERSQNNENLEISFKKSVGENA